VNEFLKLVSTPEGIAAAAGTALSLIMSYVPGLNVKWATRAPETKQATMAGLSVVIATIAAFAAPEGFNAGRWITSVVAALLLNQNVHRVSPETKAVKRAKARVARRKEAKA
jgi:hypothetical protein